MPPQLRPIAEPVRPAKDTPKSRRTRARILDRATSLMADVGYQAATNAVIAEAASLTRGAMLYHFPSREALVEALVDHLQSERRRLFDEAARSREPGADIAEHAIDTYWTLLRTPAMIAFRELVAVARTDAMVAERIAPAQAAFDRTEVGEPLMRLFHAGGGARLQAGRDLARFVLEGLAQGGMTYDADERTEHLLGVLKRAVHMLNRKGDAAELWPE